MAKSFPKGHNKEYYLDRIIKTATDVFLERVCEVYKLNDKPSAISMLRSNNLWEICDFMADYYFDKYGVKEDELTPKEIVKVNKRESQRKWRKKNEKIVKEKYRPKEAESNLKHYYEEKGYENLIDQLKNRAEALNLEILDQKNLTKNIFEKLKNKKIERIIIIYK